MNKKEFLHELRSSLRGLNDDDIDEKISFYSEMIDDRIEEGYSEEEAVSEIGTVDDVILDVAKDAKLIRLLRQKVRPKRKITGFEIALFIIGFPLWFPLLLTFVLLAPIFIFLFYILDFVFFTVDLSAGAAGVWTIIVTCILLLKGSEFSVGYLGMGLISLGFSVLFFFACIRFAKVSLRVTRKGLIGIKSWFIRGGRYESI